MPVYELHVEGDIADHTMGLLRRNRRVDSVHAADDLPPHKPGMTVIVIQAQMNITEVGALPNVMKAVAK